MLDTNVLVAALRSRRGASFRVLHLVGSGKFEIALSVPLVLEYEEVLNRLTGPARLEAGDIDVLLDYLCSVSHKQGIFYLWRPFLRDPKDDMVLELAVAAGGENIVTHNVADFVGTEEFGIKVMTPRQFLYSLEATS